MRVWSILALLALLAGCAGPPRAPEPAPEGATAESAQEAEITGEYLVAAREYERLAQTAEPPLKQQYLLSAVEALIRGGQTQTARQKLEAIPTEGIDPAVGARTRVIEARLALAEGEPQRALARLDEAARVPQLNPPLLADLHEARAQAELALNRPIEAARQYVQRDRYLAGRAAADNQMALWRTLESVPAERLRAELATADPLLAGWIELMLAAREHSGNAVATNHAIAQWRARYPEHPAGQELLDTLALGAPIFTGRIERIALLLPLTSDYAVAAEALRDGFLAMHARTPEAERPRVTIYDLGPDPTLAPQVYERAVAEGAQVVVGPLGREAADAIVRNTSLSVPTLLLSHTDEKPAGAARLFQFGLPPEQEARQAAERAYLDGCRQAAVLYPAGAWGERLMNAFTTYWQRLGGLVLASEAYSEGDTDYAEPVKRLLNIHQSEARRRMIEKQIGRPLRFEARPRRDVECVFLAATARSARLIKPQLNYHRARHLPVYATSHIYTGKPDPVHDADLDGIQFGDMPWMLVQNGRIAELRRTLQGDWPYVGTDLDRLYALGVDSYAILPHLNRISTDSAARYPGVTSGLSLDPDGRLHRQLAWAQFRNGVPRLLNGQPH
ncbi:MAG TPA: penicillin-binding protein activator [Burkholderiales bacterium]